MKHPTYENGSAINTGDVVTISRAGIDYDGRVHSVGITTVTVNFTTKNGAAKSVTVPGPDVQRRIKPANPVRRIVRAAAIPPLPEGQKLWRISVLRSATDVVDTVAVIAPTLRDAGFVAIREVRRRHELGEGVALFASQATQRAAA